MTWLVVGAVLPSLLVAWAAGHAVRRLAPRWGFVDQPAHRKVHTAATPLGGGIAIYLAIVLPLAVGQAALFAIGSGEGESVPAWATALPCWDFVAPHVAGLNQQAGRLWELMAAATALLVLGLLDDRRGLDWRLRLTVQVAVAAWVVWRGWRLSLFGEVPWITGPLSVVWIVGLVNSFNMLDNMDGLAAGVAAIAATVLAVVLLSTPEPWAEAPQLFVGGLLLVLAGSLLGFLAHNRPPARLFMGDGGAYLIGFLIATCTLMASYAGGRNPAHAVLAPLCVLAVPLYDTVSVISIRLSRGQSPFHADQNHFSHRLVQLGFTRTTAVLTIYLTTVTTSLGALLLHQVDTLGAAVILLLVGCVLMVIATIESTARRKNEP